MSTKNTLFEKFRQRMIEHGKYVQLSKDSSLRKILGLEVEEIDNPEEVKSESEPEVKEE
jgi:hypothetical protein